MPLFKNSVRKISPDLKGVKDESPTVMAVQIYKDTGRMLTPILRRRIYHLEVRRAQ